MKIVVDTNVVISGLFFGGKPGEIIKAIVNSKIKACATTEIIDEYSEIVERMVLKKHGEINVNLLLPLINSFEIIRRKSNIKISRDPDDDKFIECAIDGKALYIVSGDEDLLEIKKYGKIKIVTVKEFCEKFL